MKELQNQIIRWWIMMVIPKFPVLMFHYSFGFAACDAVFAVKAAYHKIWRISSDYARDIADCERNFTALACHISHMRDKYSIAHPVNLLPLPKKAHTQLWSYMAVLEDKLWSARHELSNMLHLLGGQ